MKNASDVRKELAKMFNEVRAGTLDPANAKELTNICGKMIASAAVQVKYFAERNEKVRIDFLDEPETSADA